jgi:phosphoenolpyruvate-protein phosphotransferase
MDSLLLHAPLSGIMVPLERVPDPVFSQRLAGDGVSIEPLSSELLAPCDAEVLQVHRAGHALTLDARGVQIMIHIGIDTVNLKGEGFTPHVKAGDQVRTGDRLITFNADSVAVKARSLMTQMLITNSDEVRELRPRSGTVTAGRDVALEVFLANGAAASAPAPGRDEFEESAPVVITSDTGLHARPAAVIAATARKFNSEIRLVKDNRDANARSVVSIMALEVMSGDAIRVTARGDDAAAAIAAITNVLGFDDHETNLAITESQAARSLAPVTDPHLLRGVAAAPGVAVGQVYQMRHQEPDIEERATDAGFERRELDAAIATAHLQLDTLQARLAEEADTERAAIFAAHQELLEDPEVLDAASASIRGGASAPHAWRQAYHAQAERIAHLRNPLLAARASDMRDVGKRVLHLLIGHEAARQEIPPGSVLITEDLTPSETATLDRSRVAGICTSMGSATSHVAIIARALGIPAVAGVDPRALELPAGTRIIIDGDAGTLNPQPSAEQESAIARAQAQQSVRAAADLETAQAPAVTTDGHRIEIAANIGAERDAVHAVELGAEGAGLLRTEFLFMDRRTAPDEDEQTRVYRAIVQAFGRERKVVIRALDVGGDKPLSYLPIGAEANPFLGERGVRLLLNKPDVLRTQIRAILRAAEAGNVALMFPMISTIAEWNTVRAMVLEEQNALGAPRIETGIMVETAAAALIADRFAETADFFSVGTNDLTQYTLAMDRTNPRMAAQIDALHPAVLRLIERTVVAAQKHKRWVGVCGALASDPAATPVLIGLGVDELSVSVPAVPAVKARVRALSYETCRTTAQSALDAPDAETVRALVAAQHGEQP